MDTLCAFISYSSVDKYLAGRLKNLLQWYGGYEIFVAHDDLTGGTIFAEEITKYITRAEFFIPLLTQSFKESDFTNQETGMAVVLDKEIIPVKLEAINPYGFINKYHALQLKPMKSQYPHHDVDNLKEVAIAICKISLSYEKNGSIYTKAKTSIAHAFCTSSDFYHTIAILQIIGQCDDFTKEELKEITEAIKTNRCVYDARGISEFKKFLTKTYKIKLD